VLMVSGAGWLPLRASSPPNASDEGGELVPISTYRVESWVAPSRTFLCRATSEPAWIALFCNIS
jgi:hypothetical protein